MTFIQYKNREEDIRDIVGGRCENVKRVVIYRQITYDDGVTIEMPSVLNAYLKKFKNASSTSNAKNAANVICPFLNYCNIQAIDDSDDNFTFIRKKGLVGLDFYHAASYLNYCIDNRKIKLSTAEQYTTHILDFYQFLIDLDIVDTDKVKIEMEPGGRYGKKEKRKNPFKNARYLVSYPSKDKGKKRKLNNLDEHLWQLFLKTSEKVQPDITLGLAFQFFGGLRRGEVVNLAIEDMIHLIKRDINGIKKDSSKMDINISDRQIEFFLGRDVDISKCGVKKPGEQQIINFNGKLYDYYASHIEYRNKIISKTNSSTNALFVNEEGYPMDGLEFEKKWNRVKRAFLRVLEKESYSNYNELTSNVRWGTHIGRGIFTNLCLTYGIAKDARTLANLRRDDSDESSKPYVDSFNISKQIIKSFEFITQDVGD